MDLRGDAEQPNSHPNHNHGIGVLGGEVMECVQVFFLNLFLENMEYYKPAVNFDTSSLDL